MPKGITDNQHRLERKMMRLKRLACCKAVFCALVFFGALNELVLITQSLAQTPAPGLPVLPSGPVFDSSQLAPVIDRLREDEAEFFSALKAADAERLEKLSWRNAKVAFQMVKSDPVASPGDPAATALRQAYVQCANAHSAVGMLAGIAARTLVDAQGGDNTAVLNDMARDSFVFFLKPFHQRRAQCAAKSNGALQESIISEDAKQVLPSQDLIAATPFTEADKEAWRTSLAGFQVSEAALASAIAKSDFSLVESTIAPVQTFSRMIARRDHSGLSHADYALVKECRWQIGHFRQLQGNVKDALARPEMAASFLEEAKKSLEDYGDSKSGCASVLKAPASSATVYLTEQALTKQ
jgi:hypothetical protein